MCKQNSEANIPNQVNGVGFIRSRKSMDKVNNMCEALVNKAEAFGVKVLEVIVDDGGSQDIDRDQISRLCTWMENSCVNVIFVCRITDVTMDMADLENFLIKAFELEVAVFDISQNAFVKYEHDNGAGC